MLKCLVQQGKLRKTLIKKRHQHMWYYFYSHLVCWYKVLHLSQTSFAWVVKVKADLPLHCGSNGCPISGMISPANINRTIPVSIWQLHHHTVFSHFLRVSESAPRKLQPHKISLRRRHVSQVSFQEKPENGFLWRPNICSDIFSQFSSVFSKHMICCFQLLLLERLLKICLFLLRFCLTLNASYYLSYWIVVYAVDMFAINHCRGVLKVHRNIYLFYFKKKTTECFNSQSLAGHAFCLRRRYTNK